jgi:hypothetical protein
VDVSQNILVHKLFLFLILILNITPALGREWEDRNGIVIDATLYHLNSSSVGLRLRGGKVVEVRKDKLSLLDQDYLRLMEANKSTCQRLRVEIFQATNYGALCAVYKTRLVRKQRKVKDYYSWLDKKQYYTTETYEDKENFKIYDLAFIEGLTTVIDGDTLDLLAWENGNYNYVTIENAKKTVPKFSLDPITSLVPIKQFGQ